MIRAALVVLVVLVPVAQAADVPQDAGKDLRVQWADYDPDDVVTVVSRSGYGTTLVLDPGEVIGRPIVGYPEGWIVEVASNLVSVSPVPGASSGDAPIEPNPADWNTSLHIPTSERLYTIDLSLATPESPPAAYTVRYRYPEERARERAEERLRQAEAAETARAVGMLPAAQNTDYTVAVGEPPSLSIKPVAVWDDGRLTYLRFGGDIPSVFALDSAGNESTVNATAMKARPDVIVIDRLAAGFVLRLGQAVVGVYNNGVGNVPALPGGSAVR